MKYVDDKDSFHHCKNLACTLKSKTLTSQLNFIDERGLFLHVRGVYGKHINSSTSPLTSKIACFATLEFSKGNEVGCFRSKQIGQTVLDVLNGRSVYKECSMAITF